jgi:hypothetical protein
VSTFANLKTRWQDIKEKKSRHFPKLKGLVFEHRVPAKALQTELATLFTATLDTRFLEASRAIVESNLVDAGGNWRNKVQPVYGWNWIWEPFAINNIDHFLKRGDSLRMALAKTSVHCQWDGNSFEAATKDLERLWRRWVKSQAPVPSVKEICEEHEERINLFVHQAKKDPSMSDADLSAFLSNMEAWRDLVKMISELRWLESIEL